MIHFRHLAKRRLKDIMRRHKPKGYRVRIKKTMEVGQGYISYRKKTINVPPVDSAHALLVYLHECGHFHMTHFHRKQKPVLHREEFEAELYALNAMRAERVFVPLDVRQACREYVTRCILKDRRKRVPIAHHVLLWTKGR